MLYKYLRKDEKRSREASKFLGRNITVYWNNEFENFVIHLNGKYWAEVPRGQQISYIKLKKRLYLSNPDNSRVGRKKVTEQVEHNKFKRQEEEKLRGSDAARDAVKYGLRGAVSVVTS